MYFDPCILYSNMKTPQQSYAQLARALGVPELYLKREDLHKYGLHKGRSIPLLIKTYAKEGYTAFAISSSGNAALAAVRAEYNHNKNKPNTPITVSVFVGEHINEKKLERLQREPRDERITLTKVARPAQKIGRAHA